IGCTLNCDPSWLSVFSPRIASIATRALNFGLYCFLVFVIDLSSVNDSDRNISLLTGLISGDHYSFHIIPTHAHDADGVLREVGSVLDTPVEVLVEQRTASEHLQALLDNI